MSRNWVFCSCSNEIQLDSISGCSVQNNLSQISFKNELDAVIIENSIVVDRCDLKHASGVEAFNLYDLNGRLIKSKTILNKDHLSIDMTDLEIGLYFLELLGKASTKVFKIMKK